MNTIAVPIKEYKHLLKRQKKVEAELDFIKKIVLVDDEKFIRPSILKKWERISRDMENGKGLFFDSVAEMRKWLKNLHHD